jgi:hypothetical protein
MLRWRSKLRESLVGWRLTSGLAMNACFEAANGDRRAGNDGTIGFSANDPGILE